MIRIGTGDYCGTCGTRAGSEAGSVSRQPAAKPNAPVRRSMDIGPARRGAPQVSPRLARTFVVSGGRSGKLISDVGPRVSAPAPGRPSNSTTVGHARINGKQVNLRQPAAHTAVISEPFNERFERAKKIGRSTSVAKFSQHFQSTVAKDRADNKTVSGKAAARSQGSLPAAAATHHEALTKLIAQMPPVNVPNASSRIGRVGAVVAAVLIMGTYVWLQNYPKMAIQAAGNKAGLSASMPGFVPSSYKLKKTSTRPGLVTLQFASPNQPANLTIAQNRTDWDSNSLLDNFVIKQGSEYAAVSGQGLTVYLFSQNQATWINHGVWYSITGASRLSREQILKIAYSL